MTTTLELPSKVDDCHKLIVDLVRSSETHKATIQKLQLEIKELKAMVKLANHKLYDTSSEKSKYFDEYLEQKFKVLEEAKIDIQLDLFNDIEAEFNEYLNKKHKYNPEEKQEKKPKKDATPKDESKEKYKDRLTENPNLPVETCKHSVTHDFCEKCKEGDYQELPPEKTRQIEIIPAKVYIIEHVCEKVVCNCGTIKRGDKPLPPLNKCCASASLLSHIAYNRFGMHLPYYRQVNDFKSLGLDVSDSNLCNWMNNLAADLFAPLYEEIKKIALNTDTLLCDETVVKEQAKGKCKTMYLWAYSNPTANAMVFDYSNRSRENPSNFLKDYHGLYLLTDKYAGYNFICKLNKIKRCYCWVHARRKFHEIIKGSDDPDELASVKEIYDLMTKMLNEDEWLRKNVPRDELVAKRKLIVAPIIDEIFKKLDHLQSIAELMTLSSIKEAIRYTLSAKEEFKNFMDHPDLEPSNNESERNLRFITIGRKNWLFTGSARGGRTLAIMATIVSNAKLNDLNVREYLEYIINKLPTTKMSELHTLLPQNYKNQPALT